MKQERPAEKVYAVVVPSVAPKVLPVLGDAPVTAVDASLKQSGATFRRRLPVPSRVGVKGSLDQWCPTHPTTKPPTHAAPSDPICFHAWVLREINCASRDCYENRNVNYDRRAHILKHVRADRNNKNEPQHFTRIVGC